MGDVPAVFLAEWFWIDRWMGSSAFLLPLEARGLYREMLTQAWRRGAELPRAPEAIRRATGVSLEEWERAWPLVEKYWTVDGDRLVNPTQLEVYGEALRRHRVQQAKGAAGAAARWGQGKAAGPVAVKGKSWKFSNLFISPKMHACIAAVVGKVADRLDWDALYQTAAADYHDHGVPANKLDDLQARARTAAGRLRDVSSVSVTAAKRAEVEATPALDAEARARIKESLRGVLGVRR